MTRVIRNLAGESLDYMLHAVDSDRSTDALVVIGHGVTGNKDRAWAVALANAIARSGCDALRFSFSGNGDSEGSFEDSCPTKEVADLGAVLDAFPDRPITYIGHSMGAAVGVIRAARDERIRKLVSLAGMVDTAAFAARKFGEVTPGAGFMWDIPECPLSESFMLDMNTIGSVEPLAVTIAIPWLLVHGDADTVVPLAESQAISARACGAVSVTVLPGADHVFNGQGEAAMVIAVLAWLEVA